MSRQTKRLYVNSEFHIIEIKHRVLEYWKQWKTVDYTARKLEVSPSSIDKYRQILKYELDFELERRGNLTAPVFEGTYTDYVIEQLKNFTYIDSVVKIKPAWLCKVGFSFYIEVEELDVLIMSASTSSGPPTCFILICKN